MKDGKVNKKKLAKFYISLIFIIYILFCLGAVSANALVYVTPSATWDIKTPPYTPEGTPDVGELFPTVTATVNSVCPVGTIVGYGTTTPGLNWMLSCGSCLPDGTATPTFDFESIYETNQAGTTTATASITPGGPTFTSSPTSTSTVTPTATTAPDAVVIVDYDVNLNTWVQTYDYGVASCYQFGDGIKCDYEFEKFGTSGGHEGAQLQVDFTVPLGTIYFYVDGTATGAFWYNHPVFSTVVDVGQSASGQFGSTGFEPTTGIGAYSDSWTVTSTGLSGSATINVTGASFQGANYLQGSLYIFAHPYDPASTPTPSPTVTTTPALGYCGSIDSSEYDYESWFNVIGLTGSQQCFFTPYISATDYFGSGWMAFFNFLFPDEVVDFIAEAVIPAQTWCFYGFGFTRIQIFTIMVDPTIFADLGIVLFVVAHFLNK